MLSRSPCHDQASKHARSGLFKALVNFAELELRIAQLATEKERGDAFEVFVEAYLSTDEMVQAAEVWVIGKVPGEVRRQLNLPSKDYGYDGVFRTKLGELVPYQAKFRSGRTSLPYAELATFFGISEKADRRVVLTNSIAISAVAESRTGFQTTRGGDFDRLDAAQLTAIDAWIDGIAPAPLVREPRPHQRAALADIEQELSTRDRATVVMACGTGKTLVALWAAESAQPKRVLVLVPSLNLLRQTLHEWAKWTNWGERFRYLCVCSDPKVAKDIDEIEIRPEDTDFPVRTDPAIVGRFLDHSGDTVSVVFCTYQSAPVVGEAMKGRPSFDLGIFDEAHKTTGREGTRYAFALRDKNLPIRKRLFLTATPRHYDIHKRDNEGDFAVASMDDERVYGRVAHRLTFARAAEQKIIVPYKVVISVVDSEMIDNALMDQSEVSIKGDPVRAKWVAHQIALKRAVEEHDLKRIITFHSSIKAAAAFASDDSEGVGIHLPNFQRFHVSGEQPTAERDEHMREFARVQRGVITNARCLTEGVDVPSVDMVAFMNPRRSKVDIIQAVGRAMRTEGKEKTCGYVLVPLFLEMRKGETFTEAVRRSDFDEIAQVLNDMRESDDELSEILQTLAVDRGRTGGFDDARFGDKVQVLGPQIQLSELTGAIRARLVEELGITWDERYGQLIAYKQTHRDCNVPHGWKDNPKLGSWCAIQRNTYKNNKLSPDRTKRLEKLGFEWSPRDAAWDQMFDALAAYQRAHRNLTVPRYLKDNLNLRTWCDNQRALYKNNTLPIERVKWLEQLGFEWHPSGVVVTWDEMFDALVAYKDIHGDLNVPRQWKDNPKLGNWPRIQRRNYKNNKLSADRVKRLEQLGFVWNPIGDAWDQMFDALAAYKQTHGDCDVSRRWKGNSKLELWCTTQRAMHKNNKLSADRVKRLEQLGFVWNPIGDAWDQMFDALAAYKQTHGDCNVPRRWKGNSKLELWCTTQRAMHKNNKLSTDRVKRFEQLGFEWSPLDPIWEQMFAALSTYKQTHGDCNVPWDWKGNQELAMWCHGQNNLYRDNRLPADRVKRLEDIGFGFVLREPKTK
jgi:superfamily II DNA or RNA helicase